MEYFQRNNKLYIIKEKLVLNKLIAFKFIY